MSRAGVTTTTTSSPWLPCPWSFHGHRCPQALPSTRCLNAAPFVARSLLSVLPSASPRAKWASAALLPTRTEDPPRPRANAAPQDPILGPDTPNYPKAKRSPPTWPTRPPPGPPRGSPAPPRSRSPAGPPPGPRSPTGPGRPPPPRSPSSARQRGYHGQLRHTHAAATSHVTASRRTYGTRSRPAGGGGVDPNSAAIQRARTPLPPPGGGRGLSARSDWLRAATRRAKGLGAAQVGPRGVGARGLSVTHCCAVRARHEVSVQLCGCAVSSALRGSVKRGECDVAPLEACSADGVRGSVTWSMPWGCVQWSGCSAVPRGGALCC